MLASKYMRGEPSITKLKAKQGSSNVWRGITIAKEVLELGMGATINSEKTTLFWREPWLEHTPLLDIALKDITLADSYKNVEDLWILNQGWRWATLNGLLPQTTINKLATVMIREQEDEDDSIQWKPTSSGKFTVNSAYMIAT